MFKLKSRAKEMDNNYKIGTLVTRSPNSLIAEQYRKIRTNIQFSMVDKSIQSFIVTSAGSGAGKSVISANLSSVLALKNKKVLLVDADLRRPTIHKIFGLMNDKGLTNLLTEDQALLDDHIFQDHASGLYILTSGVAPHNPAELLGSNRMKNVIEKMKEMFDVVVFDMPPVLPVTDAQILSTEVDGVIFVIPYGEVSLDDANKAKVSLEKVNANIIGTIINRTKIKSNSDFYLY